MKDENGASGREAAPWILTNAGEPFDLLSPKASAVRIEDIAHHLSLLCRFTGACRTHYAVAQHCVHVASLVPGKMALAALLHDAHEAYIGDFSSPLKTAMRAREFEPSQLSTPVDLAIGEAFGVDLVHQPEEIRFADLKMLATEMRDLLPHSHTTMRELPDPCPWPVVPWTAEMAEKAFLYAFDVFYFERRSL